MSNLYLLIDRGNTATKAAIYDDSGFVALEIDSDPCKAVHRAMVCAPQGVKRAVLSTVAAGGAKALAFLSDYAPDVIVVRGDIPLPIHIPESMQSTLGADRIAADAGAYCLYGGVPLLVVDSGTAVTFDVLSADGTVLGGNIAPGLRLGLDALHRHTALLPEVEVPTSTNGSLMGHDTVSAMVNGVVWGVVGAIESMCRRLGSDTRVVLTGGNAPLLAGLVDVPAVYAPHLVLDGLNIIGRNFDTE